MNLITWHQDYPGGARQVARLGGIAVGAVICSDSDKKVRQAQWLTWLPGESGGNFSNWTWVKTEDAAKSAVSAEVTGWLKRAGILSLAERDRADAASLPLFSEPAQKDVAVTPE